MRRAGEDLGENRGQNAVPGGEEKWIAEPPRRQHHLVEHNLLVSNKILNDLSYKNLATGRTILGVAYHRYAKSDPNRDT